MQMDSTQKSATLPFLEPALEKQRQLEDQLSESKEENLALVNQNLELQSRVPEFESRLLMLKGEIASLQKQLSDLQEKLRHIERKAFDAEEDHKRSCNRAGRSSAGIQVLVANHSDRSTDSSRVTTAKITKNDQAAATAPSPRTPDKALEKRSIRAASSGAAVSRERGAAKRVKTADQKSPQRKEEVFGRAYFGGKSLLGKDDIAYQRVLE